MKKKLIFSAIVVVIIIAILLFAHYAPVWVSLTNIITFIVGAAIGWIARIIYEKYFKEADGGNENE